MTVLPPGTLLQLMYLKDRLKTLPPGKFIEIGPGSGEITNLLLRMGWVGKCYDLDHTTTTKLQSRFGQAVAQGRLEILNADFITHDDLQADADLIVHCMVMEHLDEASQYRFLNRAKDCLSTRGRMVGLVPASDKYWGIDDDIAGHMRRYTRDMLQSLFTQTNWSLQHVKGLTFPISNMLLPLSNYLVRRSEASKLRLSMLERTKLSGRRDVKFKTNFPSLLGLLLNQYTMLPLHALQKIFSNSERCMVLYFEVRPNERICP